MNKSSRSEPMVEADSVIGIEEGLAAIGDAPDAEHDATFMQFDDSGSESGSETSIIAPETAHIPVSGAVIVWLRTVAGVVALDNRPLDLAPKRRPPDWNPIASDAEYPQALTANAWNGSPGRLIRKFDGKPELERALAELELAYGEIDWQKLRMPKPSPFSIKAWHEVRNSANEERFKTDRVRDKALAVRALAGSILKSRQIGKTTADQCINIRARADELLQSCSDSYLGAEIDTRFDQVFGREQEAADALNNEIPDRVAAALTAIREVKSDEEWSKAGIQQEIRKITVALAQGQRLRDAGFDIQADLAQSQKWYGILRPYGERKNLGSASPEAFADQQRRVAGMLGRLLQEGLNEFTPLPDTAAVAPRPLPRPRPARPQLDEATAATPSLSTTNAVDDKPQGTVNSTMPSLPIVSEAIPYSEELTSQHWTQNRGRSKLAKITGKTGMGQALRDLENLYKPVPWDNLSLVNPKPFVLDEWKRRYEAAIEALRMAEWFYAQADRVHTLALEIKKSRISPRSEKLLCDKIIGEIEKINNSFHRKTTLETLKSRYERAIDYRKHTLSSLHSEVPALVKRCLDALREVKTEEDWTKSPGIPKLSRNITQVIGNAQTLHSAGFTVLVDIPRCMQLFGQLTPYADNGAPSSIDDRGFDFHHRALEKILIDMQQTPIEAR